MRVQIARRFGLKFRKHFLQAFVFLLVFVSVRHRCLIQSRLRRPHILCKMRVLANDSLFFVCLIRWRVEENRSMTRFRQQIVVATSLLQSYSKVLFLLLLFLLQNSPWRRGSIRSLCKFRTCARLNLESLLLVFY